MPRLAPGERAEKKLTMEEQHSVCEWLAAFMPPPLVRKKLLEKFGKDLAERNIYYYLEAYKWKPLIEQLRQKWALSVMELPMAHKRGRLEKLILLLERAERNDKVTEWAKINQCKDLLKEMREEMESGKVQFTNTYLTVIHNYTDEELVRRREEVLERLKQLGGKNALRRSITSQGIGLQDQIIHQAGVSQGQVDGEEVAPQAGQSSGQAHGNGAVDASQISSPTEIHGDAGAQPQDGQGEGHQDVLPADA